MTNPVDFRARQVQVNKIIANDPDGPTNKIIVYGREASTDNQGGVSPTVFPQSASIALDTFLYVSGAVNSRNSSAPSIAVFGGDLIANGAFYQGGASPVKGGVYSHAEGKNTNASGGYSHAEGFATTASGLYSHAEGFATTASGEASHAEGSETIAFGPSSHAEGFSCYSSQTYAHAEGYLTTGSGYASHAEGYKTIAEGSYSHAEGYQTIANGNHSHAEGKNCYTFDHGGSPTQTGEGAHVEGEETSATGNYSHAEGYQTATSGAWSHAEGKQTNAYGQYSHAEGYNCYASQTYAHAEGYLTTGSGDASHAEGYLTYADGDSSHAEGRETRTVGRSSHAEGFKTRAFSNYSHAEGCFTTSSAQYSHASGIGTITKRQGQNTVGEWNLDNNTSSYFAIGNGSSDATRSDIFRAESTGELVLSGGIRHNAVYTVLSPALTKQNYLVIVNTQGGSRWVFLPEITDTIADIGLTVRIRQNDTPTSGRTLAIIVHDVTAQLINGFDAAGTTLTLGDAGTTGTNTNRSVTLTYMGVISGYGRWFVVETSTC